MISAGPAAVFLDRDGVLNELVADPVSGQPESPLEPSAVRLIPGAAEAVLALRTAGWRLVGVSNQPAAAKGKVNVEELDAVQARVLELLAAEGACFDAFRLCLHHPEGTVAELSGPCACRKPAPGMLLDAAEELGLDLAASLMVGDTDGDILAGRSAGCKTILVEYPGSAHKRTGLARPDAVASSLSGASRLPLLRNQVG